MTENQIIELLASSLGRGDEEPNIRLAESIVKTKDEGAVHILVDQLKNKSVQNDCIKVLYEIGHRNPSLISPYLEDFTGHLQSSNNRLQWGAMAALDCITEIIPLSIHKQLSPILSAADSGSVITRDHAVNILIKLCRYDTYHDQTWPLLMEQLSTSPVNQLPMYAERILPVVKSPDKDDFEQVLRTRMEDVHKESKRRRIEKVISKINKP